MNQNQPEAAMNALRLALNVIRSATDVSEDVRTKLERRVQAQLMSVAQAEERVVAERAERTRLDSAAEQRTRTIDHSAARQADDRSDDDSVRPADQRGRLQRSLQRRHGQHRHDLGPVRRSAGCWRSRPTPSSAAGRFRTATTTRRPRQVTSSPTRWVSTAQEIQFRMLTKYRFLLTMQDITRASVPFPDTQTIEYPDAAWWRYISERRIRKYGKAVDLFDRDDKTKRILEKLDEPISMSFNEETPLEDVSSTSSRRRPPRLTSGIPIYVDPIGLSEADKTMASTVRNMDLEGVPLKLTLKLLLNQLDLTYTVKDGFLMITSKESEDQQTEIRVYPVADLAIIPLSLMGGGGMGGGGMWRHGRRYGWRYGRHGRRYGRWHGRRYGRRHGRRHGRNDVCAGHRSSGSGTARRCASIKKKASELRPFSGPRPKRRDPHRASRAQRRLALCRPGRRPADDEDPSSCPRRRRAGMPRPVANPVRPPTEPDQDRARLGHGRSPGRQCRPFAFYISYYHSRDKDRIDPEKLRQTAWRA